MTRSEDILEPTPPAPAVAVKEQVAADPETSPEASAAEGSEDVQAGPETAPGEEEEDESPPDPSSAGPERVMIGRAEGLHFRVPVGTVQGILGEAAQARLDVLRTSTSIAALQERMRTSDGRCTPMIFTVAEQDPQVPAKEPPQLFAGLESLAAAMELGLSHVSVITIRSGDAGDVQSHMARPVKQTAETEDDLVYRVMAED